MQVIIYIHRLRAYGTRQSSRWCLSGLWALANVTQHIVHDMCCKDCYNEAFTSHSLHCDLQHMDQEIQIHYKMVQIVLTGHHVNKRG